MSNLATRFSLVRFSRLLGASALALSAFFVRPNGSEAQATPKSAVEPAPEFISGFVCSVSYVPSAGTNGKYGHVLFTVFSEPNCQGTAFEEPSFPGPFSPIEFRVLSTIDQPTNVKGVQYSSRAEIMMMFEQLRGAAVDAARVRFKWSPATNDRSVSRITFLME